MTTLVFMLEEPSAREMLRGIVPSILPEGVDVRYICFEGKQDLQHQLPRKLRGWLAPDTRFIVMEDQDRDDCHALKGKLRQFCHAAGKSSALIRIACRELESFYLGDLAATAAGLQMPSLESQQGKSRYRNPDQIHKPSSELIRLSQRTYQKVSGSRAIAPYLRLDQTNSSHSFNVLVSGIRRVAAQPGGRS